MAIGATWIGFSLLSWAHAQTGTAPQPPAIDIPNTSLFQNQQDTADRLWQNNQSRVQQSNKIDTPTETSRRAGSSYESALRALTQNPKDRLQQLSLEVLNAVNRQDWFGADRLLRIYARDPQHDPSLFDFVEASHDAAKGDYEAAIESYRKVVQASPGFTRSEIDLGRTLFIDNQLREAQEVFKRLQAQALPPVIGRHIQEYTTALENRTRPQFSLTLAWAREDNLNNANTVVNPCALNWNGACFQNNPGKKVGDSGVYFEASINKLWPISGHHGVVLRSLNYGNHYANQDSYDNLASVNYLGYQYSSARTQFQLLPSFEYDREGRYTAYRAAGIRASWRQQLSRRFQLEASLDYKHRDFSSHFGYLQGDLRGVGLFGSYALRPDWVLYANLLYRESDAQNRVFAYGERIARIGVFKAFGNRFTVNLAYGYRQKRAEETYAFFGKRQRDHERSVYLNVTAPRWAWQGFTPMLTYEYRNNRSSIPHAYDYEKNRITLGFNKTF